jgi:small subunit ribosomal protein S9
MKTYVAKPTDRERNWLVVDATGLTLGRLATQIADALRGKRKPEYTPHIDTGDFVIVVNAEKITVTGGKRTDKKYYRHSGYPGGLKVRTFDEMMERRPEEVIRLAVKGMLRATGSPASRSPSSRSTPGPIIPRGAEAATDGAEQLVADETTPPADDGQGPGRRPGGRRRRRHRRRSGRHGGLLHGHRPRVHRARRGPGRRSGLRRVRRRPGLRGRDPGRGRRFGRDRRRRGHRRPRRRLADPSRERPAIPGADLEVDIIIDGEDRTRRPQYGDEEDLEAAADEQLAAADEETVEEPITQVAIDLRADARYTATGKRKSAIARVILKPGTGAYIINGKTMDQYFPRPTLQRTIRQPLETGRLRGAHGRRRRMTGGGVSAQAGALRHGISRALLEADPNLRGELKRRGFLTRDARAKERKKAGLKKARKKPQFSKR